MDKDRLKDCCPECYKIEDPLFWEVEQNIRTAIYHCKDCKKTWPCYYDAAYIRGVVNNALC